MKYLNIKKALAAWQELQPLSEKDRERDENVWWYDGERIAFRTPNYTM